MEFIKLICDAPFEEVIEHLLRFYQMVEDKLATRLPFNLWEDQKKREGAKAALDMILRKDVERELQRILPGHELTWDDQITIPAVYSTANIALVDLVDGAKEYARQGAAVTSHIGVFTRIEESIGQLEIGIISYPFHRFRLVSVGEGEGQPVFYIPFEFNNIPGDTKAKLEQRQVRISQDSKQLGDWRVVDRYVRYNADDMFRRNLDRLRDLVIQGCGTYLATEGSVAKTITDVTLGKVDVAILQHDPKPKKRSPPLDYLTPSIILQNRGGVFRDVHGNETNRRDSIDGFIAARNRAVYNQFMEELHR